MILGVQYSLNDIVIDKITMNTFQVSQQMLAVVSLPIGAGILFQNEHPDNIKYVTIGSNGTTIFVPKEKAVDRSDLFPRGVIKVILSVGTRIFFLNDSIGKILGLDTYGNVIFLEPNESNIYYGNINPPKPYRTNTNNYVQNNNINYHKQKHHKIYKQCFNCDEYVKGSFKKHNNICKGKFCLACDEIVEESFEEHNKKCKYFYCKWCDRLLEKYKRRKHPYRCFIGPPCKCGEHIPYANWSTHNCEYSVKD